MHLAVRLMLIAGLLVEPRHEMGRSHHSWCVELVNQSHRFTTAPTTTAGRLPRGRFDVQQPRNEPLGFCVPFYLQQTLARNSFQPTLVDSASGPVAHSRADFQGFAASRTDRLGGHAALAIAHAKDLVAVQHDFQLAGR